MQYFCNTAFMKSLVTVTNRGVVTLPASLRRASESKPTTR
jgi:bifunctional DNA-binding transcriptional regulator/antitoxin component of YhaV-PrlF toxin-antitoxin module